MNATRCACGGIGRRAGFRFQCLMTWEFKSPQAHHTPSNCLDGVFPCPQNSPIPQDSRSPRQSHFQQRSLHNDPPEVPLDLRFPRSQERAWHFRGIIVQTTPENFSIPSQGAREPSGNEPRRAPRARWRGFKKPENYFSSSLMMRATWPVAFTLYFARAMLPCSSTTKVERITPSTTLP